MQPRIKLVVSPFILLLPFFPSLVFKRLGHLAAEFPRQREQSSFRCIGTEGGCVKPNLSRFNRKSCHGIKNLILCLCINGNSHLVIASCITLYWRVFKVTGMAKKVTLDILMANTSQSLTSF